MHFEIKNRWSLKVQYECELEAKFELESYGIQLGAAVKKAYKSGADLRDAVLSGAVLSGADLRDAVLSGADLSDADLSGAVLSGAVLRDAVLSGAVLRDFKNDFFNVLLHAPKEVSGLALALKEGRVDGSVYEGQCACLVGTIANLKHCSHSEIPGLIPDSGRPAERWFMGISKGDTPETNQIVKITLEWIEEFQGLMAVAK